QHLGPDLLEELRLLGNLEGRRGKALQVVLLAQDSLAETLHRPEAAVFRQRLSVHARLRPLDLYEAADYLVHHLRQAGGRPEAVMSDEALEILARGTRGIPRLLNRAAHAALRLACQAGAETVDAEVALESLGLQGLSEGGAPAASEGAPESAPAEGTPAAVLTLEAAPQAEGAARDRERVEDGPGRWLFTAPKRPACAPRPNANHRLGRE